MLAFRKERHGDHKLKVVFGCTEFEVSLSYIRPCQERKKKDERKTTRLNGIRQVKTKS